jgi:hypothetical protein
MCYGHFLLTWAQNGTVGFEKKNVRVPNDDYVEFIGTKMNK